MQELRDVLDRPKFGRFLPLRDRQAFCALVAKWMHVWEIPAASEQVALGGCRDEKDAKFLSLAMTCQADVLISSDADLLVLRRWQQVPIVTPTIFVDRIINRISP